MKLSRPQPHPHATVAKPQTSTNPHVPILKVRKLVEQEFSALQKQHPRVLHLALNEAEALAWEAGLPHLLFPVLALEKARAVAAWHERQKRVLHSEPILAFAE